MYRFGTFRLSLPFFDTEGGAGGGAPADAASAAPPSGGQPSAPAPGASGTPAAQPAAQPHAQPAAGFTYKEDRSTWVPSHRVRQTTEALQAAQTELALWKQRTEALSGIKAPTAPNPERDAIRNQLFEIEPGFKELLDLKDKLKELTGLDLNEIKSIRESQQQSWTARGTQVLAQVAEKAKAAYGGSDLSPKTIQRIQHAFVAEVGNDPELKARYEAGDPTIVDEFVKDFTGTILDPYRRSTQAPPQNPAARRLPRGGGGSAVVGARPATLKPSDGDAFHKAAFERFTQG